MTLEASVETVIGRSPAAVFRELEAVERYPEWLVASGVTRVERLQPGGLAPGSRLRIEQRIGDRVASLDATVVRLVPGQVLELGGRSADGISVETLAELAADGPTTRVRWSIRVGLPLRYRMFEGFVAPQVRAAVVSDLDGFKRRLESVAG